MTVGRTNARKHLQKIALSLFVLLIALFAALFGLKRAMEGKGRRLSSLSRSSAVPDVTLKSVGGSETRLSRLPGKVKLINSWATWCAPCLIEIPSILRLRERFKDRGFEVILINMDDEPDEAVPPMQRRLKINVPVYSDPTMALADFFGLEAIPLTALIDSKNQIALLEAGDRNWDSTEIHGVVEGLLKGGP